MDYSQRTEKTGSGTALWGLGNDSKQLKHIQAVLAGDLCTSLQRTAKRGEKKSLGLLIYGRKVFPVVDLSGHGFDFKNVRRFWPSK